MNDLEERTSRISPERQKVITFLVSTGFRVGFEKRGKKNYWTFSYDQGAFKGSNIYAIEQSQLTPIRAWSLCQEEGFNFNKALNEHMNQAFWQFVETHK